MEVHIAIANVPALTLKEPQRRTRQHAPTKSPTREFIQATNTIWMGLMRLGRMKNKDHALQLGLVRLGGMKKLGWWTTGGNRAPWPHENAKRMHYNWDWCAVVAWSDKVSVRHLGLMRLIVGRGEVGDGDVDGGGEHGTRQLYNSHTMKTMQKIIQCILFGYCFRTHSATRTAVLSHLFLSLGISCVAIQWQLTKQGNQFFVVSKKNLGHENKHCFICS